MQSIHSPFDLKYLFADVAEILRAVKNVARAFKKLAIKLTNDALSKDKMKFIYTYFKMPIKAKERNNTGTSHRLVVRSSKMCIPSDF